MFNSDIQPRERCPNAVCCCVPFSNKGAKAGARVGQAAVIISAIAAFIILSFVAGAYIQKAIGLVTEVNKQTVNTWLMAAKWSGVALGGGVGLIALSKIIDSVLKCSKNRSYSRVADY